MESTLGYKIIFKHIMLRMSCLHAKVHVSAHNVQAYFRENKTRTKIRETQMAVELALFK